MIRVLGCLTEAHDLRLVALAACICAMACFTTLSMMARVRGAEAHGRVWLLAAAVTFGGGAWSLHFVSMLAFEAAVPIRYDVAATAASVVVAVAGAWAALLLWRRQPQGRPQGRRQGWQQAATAGALLGLSVAGMHYTGVAAMRLPGHVTLDPVLLVASLVLAAALGAAGLLRCADPARLPRRLEGCLWLSLCICSLHFTGMAALSVVPGGGALPEATDAMIGSGPLAVTVGSVSLALLIVSLGATLMEQHLSQRAVEELRRMRVLSNISQEVMLIQRDGRVVEANIAAERLFGLSVEALRGLPLLSLVAEGSVPVMRRRELCPPSERQLEEMEVRGAGGRIVPVEVGCTLIEHGGGRATVLSLRDLTDRKRDEARIRHLAHHDALTDLPNRFLLQEQLSRCLDEAGRRGGSVALLCIDLDRFKPVNDLLGHAAGDALLVQVARRMGRELPPGDMLARTGGDEFVVVCADGDRPGRAADLAARLIEVVSRPFELEGRTVEVGASVGVALYPADGGTEAALLRAADTALYRAKEEGRGSFRMFEPAMDERLRQRRQLEQDLRGAVDRGELLLHFQPVLCCRTGLVEGFEALLRWEHPVRGRLPPGEFIPLAEESGLIVRLGEWVLDAACRAAAAWPAPLWVAVNVSPAQLSRSEVGAAVAGALSRSGLAASRLEVEVTEGVMIQDPVRAASVLRELRAQGVRVALDDFGTGFSSLGTLRACTFDKIKIDRSFVAGLEAAGEAAAIVRAIVGLGGTLGLSVTAEGVETQPQLDELRALGCDHVQGWLIGRPAPETALGRFLPEGTPLHVVQAA